MKKLSALLLSLLILLATSSGLFAPHERVRVFDADHLETYADTLNAMFDGAWTLLSVEDSFFEGHGGYICSCGFDGRPQEFIEWTVEYRDGNGAVRHFVFDNRMALSVQVERHVTNLISAYYREHFFDVYLQDIPLAPSSSISGSIVRANINTHREENQEWRHATEQYRRLLGTPEGAILLSQLTPANVFELVPMYLSIRISFSGSDSLGQRFEEEVTRSIEDMIGSMNHFTNHRLTARFSMGYREVIHLHTGERRHQWYYIQGARAVVVDSLHSGRYFFEGYRGMFW